MIKEQKELMTAEKLAGTAKKAVSGGRGTLALAVVGIAISLGSSFMFCLASIGFDFTQLGEMTFWSRWASMSISALFAYGLVVLHKDEVNRLNKWYQDGLKALAEKSAAVGDDFDEYLKEVNLKRRVEWYKNYINGKIAKLNRKLLKRELNRKPVEKLKAKIEKYKACVTEEYLEANKYVLKTRSKPFSAAQILSETKRGDGTEENFRSAAAYYGGKALAKLCFSLCSTAAFACVIVQNVEIYVNVASIVMTLMAVMAMLISVVSAILAANGCYRNIYVPNLQLKLKILSGFEKWKNEHNNDLSTESTL